MVGCSGWGVSGDDESGRGLDVGVIEEERERGEERKGIWCFFLS